MNTFETIKANAQVADLDVLNLARLKQRCYNLKGSLSSDVASQPWLEVIALIDAKLALAGAEVKGLAIVHELNYVRLSRTPIPLNKVVFETMAVTVLPPPAEDYAGMEESMTEFFRSNVGRFNRHPRVG